MKILKHPATSMACDCGASTATIGMVDRGMVAVGMAADLVVFDPATLVDRATYEEPALPSEGIRHVLVNGAVTLRNGVATGVRGGRALPPLSWRSKVKNPGAKRWRCPRYQPDENVRRCRPARRARRL